MQVLDVYIRGEPIAKGSWRPIKTRGGRVYMKPSSKRLPSYAAYLRAAINQRYDGKMLLHPVAVALNLTFVFGRPKTVSAKRRPRHVVKPDLDKLQRTVFDALTGIVIADDAQIDRVTARKLYSFDGETACRITVWTEESEVDHA